MNDLFKKFKKEAMTDSEKQIGFNQLKTFISNNPVQTPWYKNIGNRIVSPFQEGLLLHHKILATAFVIVILVSGAGGTSIAAKYSMPGDILYPVKINLNEKVETFTAISPEAQADVEVKHISERLLEAEKLDVNNKLNDGIKTQVENKFSQDLKDAMVHVDTLNSYGNTKSANKVKNNIENSLKKHKDVVDIILNTEKAKDDTTRAFVAPQETKLKANVTTFSTMQSEKIATTSPEIKKDEDEDEDDNETPLLNETLKRIHSRVKDERD